MNAKTNMPTSHPLALTPAELQRFKAQGVLRAPITFDSIEASKRRELERRKVNSRKPAILAYNRLYSQFRRTNGRNPNPIEREAIQAQARKAAV